MRLRVLASCVLALAFCTATPAAAHWEKTRWGMTVAEVRAAYPAAVPIRAGLLKLEQPYTFLGRTYPVVGFDFDEAGRLDYVLLVPAPRDTLGFLGELNRAYGDASSARTITRAGRGTSLELLFNDQANGNMVFYSSPLQGTTGNFILSIHPTGTQITQLID